MESKLLNEDHSLLSELQIAYLGIAVVAYGGIESSDTTTRKQEVW